MLPKRNGLNHRIQRIFAIYDEGRVLYQLSRLTLGFETGDYGFETEY